MRRMPCWTLNQYGHICHRLAQWSQRLRVGHDTCPRPGKEAADSAGCAPVVQKAVGSQGPGAGREPCAGLDGVHPDALQPDWAPMLLRCTRLGAALGLWRSGCPGRCMSSLRSCFRGRAARRLWSCGARSGCRSRCFRPEGAACAGLGGAAGLLFPIMPILI